MRRSSALRLTSALPPGARPRIPIRGPGRSAGFLVLLLLLVPASAAGQDGAPGGEWPHHGGELGSTKYSALDQIHPGNVDDLEVAWRRPAVADELRARESELRFGNNLRSTPLMVDGVLYASNAIGLVEAFDPGTGRTIWVQEPPEGDDGLRGSPSRAVAHWRDGDDARILAVRRSSLHALDADTGKPALGFGKAGVVDLQAGLGERAIPYYWTGAPLMVGDVVIVGQSMPDNPPDREGQPGFVRAFDVRTGELRWTFDPIPGPGEPGIETWEDRSWEYTGAANMWTLMSADPELGLVYLPLSAPTMDMYGGHRPGANLYSNSLVAVDADTGRRVWHFQTVHHDLWDYDLPAAPILADLTVDGRPVEAVVQLTKQGFAFVLDRATGEPVWPVEERPVPGSRTPGERPWATQPVPTKPPPFERQGVGIDDLVDFTPELRAEAEAIARRYVLGPLFTPPSVRGKTPESTQGTLQLPGSVGGADWNGAAFDPETGMLYVPSVTGPFTADLVPQDPESGNLPYAAGTREFVEGPRGLPLLKPPYGRITALDLNRGEIRWTVPNGDGPRDHPELEHLDLPSLGQPGRGQPLLTRTLLFVSEGSPMNVRTPPGGGGKMLRAYDKGTGEVLRETELAAGTTGAAMTYMHRGKQYIVVAIGDREHTAEFVALSLP